MELYINNKKCYLGEEFTPNFTYSFLDTFNPSAVKTGYSKTITLPDCAENALALSPFAERYEFILYENNVIKERGYCTLDDVEEEGFRKEYHLTLYGELGSFFYNLQGDSDDPKNLCDINLGFGNTLAEDNAFSQSLTPEFVYSGWMTTGSVSDIVKLVPCTWNVGGFDYTKTIVDNTGEIFPLTGSTSGSACYESGSINYLMVTAEENTPYAKQDFRVESMPIAIRYKNIIEGCCDSESNGGYTVNLDPDFFNDDNPYWTDMYLMNTVPSAETLSSIAEESQSYADWSFNTARIAVTSSKTITVTPQSSSGYWTASGNTLSTSNIIAGNTLQVSTQLYLSDITWSTSIGVGTIPGNLHIYVLVTNNDTSTTQISEIQGVTELSNWRGLDAYGTGVVSKELTHSVTVPDNWTNITVSLKSEWNGTPSLIIYAGGRIVNTLFYPDFDLRLAPGLTNISLNTVFFNVSAEDLLDPVFTKQGYLSNTGTPLEYLLGYTKMFNLRFFIHPGSKEVDILTFNNYLNVKGVKDINERIDYSRPYTETRKLIDESIINFNLEPETNTTIQKYYDNEGQNILDRRVRVKEGSEVRDYLGSSILRVGTRARQESAIAPRSVNSYYYLGFNQTVPFQLGYVSGSDVVTEDYNLNYSTSPGRYDVLEVQDPSNVVVMFAGTKDVPSASSPALISRTSVDMLKYAGKSCFLGGFNSALSEGDTGTMIGSSYKATYKVPVFSVTADYPGSDYGISFANENYDSIQITGNLFDSYFKDFIDSVYINPRKVTCWVRLDQPELRRLYYFNNAMWILSSVQNYNYNDDPVQCTFIQYSN